MNRRAALAFVACFAAAGAEGQTPDRLYRLGILSAGTTVVNDLLVPRLTAHGFTDGRNLSIAVHNGPEQSLSRLALELVATKPDVIVTVGNTATRAAQEATSVIPINMSFGDDPVGAGFANSISRPGRNITGFITGAVELSEKQLQLLGEAVPEARRFGALTASPRHAAGLQALDRAAVARGLKSSRSRRRHPGEYPAAFSRYRAAGVHALWIAYGPELFRDRDQIAALALEARLPTVCETAAAARSGCLISYGIDLEEGRKRLPDYIVRILRGEAAGELPIETVSHYRFTVNLRTAAALGLSLPQQLLARADEVIE